MAHHMFFMGGLGSGKTLLMSIVGKYLRDKVNGLGGKVELFSNYGLKDSIDMNEYQAWYEIANADESICCWDESQMAFNNRNWSTLGAQMATEVMFYTRKMRCLTMYASPSIDNVDSRIRQIVEILFICRKVGDKGFEAFIYDYQSKVFLRRIFLPMYKAKKIFEMELYDTYGMVRKFPLPKTATEIDDFWDTLFAIHQDKRERGATEDAARLNAASNNYAQNDAGIYVQNV